MSSLQKIEDLTESLKKYVNTSYELSKLEAIEQISILGGLLFGGLLIGLASCMFLFFISIAIGFYISPWIGSNFGGFAIVAGFYLIIGVIFFAVRKKVIERPIRNLIIWRIFSKMKL
jgi:hypothetical protein